MSQLPERLSNGKLPAYAWPGGYPLYYLDGVNAILCQNCANRSDSNKNELPRFKPVFAGINWEDDQLYCDDCSKRIESAYAEEKE